MVDPTSFLPKIDGFSPFPVAVMIPFMEAQSAMLARAFGLNYEIGKRTIKSMDNETFNKLTEQEVGNILSRTSVEVYDKFLKELPASQTLQKYIVTEYKNVELLKIQANIDLIKHIISNLPKMIADDNKLLALFISRVLGVPSDLTGETDFNIPTGSTNYDDPEKDTEPTNINTPKPEPEVPKYGGYGSEEAQAQALRETVESTTTGTAWQDYLRKRNAIIAQFRSYKRTLGTYLKDPDKWGNRVSDYQGLVQREREKLRDLLFKSKTSTNSDIRTDAVTKINQRYWNTMT